MKISIKYVFFAISLLTIGLFAGCTQQESSPTLLITTPPENIISRQEPLSLKFFVKNPTENTFVGIVKYTYEIDCLGAAFSNDEVEVKPKDSLAVIKQIEGRNINLPEKCIQTPLKITIVLADKSGITKDSGYVTVTIAR